MRSSLLLGGVIALAATAGSLTALPQAAAQSHHSSDQSSRHHSSDQSSRHHGSDQSSQHHSSDQSSRHHSSDQSSQHHSSDQSSQHHSNDEAPAAVAPREAPAAVAPREAPAAVAPREAPAAVAPRAVIATPTPSAAVMEPPAPAVTAQAVAPPAVVAPPAPPAVAEQTANPPPPPVTEPSPAAPARGTPLPLRSSHPINLIPAERHTGTGGLFLALFVGAAIGLGYWLRRQQAPAPSVGPELKILLRSPVGVRSDLLVVDVAGQRLLLGVTPSSIQHIAVLDHATGLATETEEPANDSANEEVRSRFVAMIDAARQSAPAPEAEPSAARTAERPHRTASNRRQSPARHEVEEQARGLLELGNLA